MSNEKKYWLYKYVGILVAIMPITIWMGVHFNEYFMNKNGWSVSIGCVASLICLFLIVKKKADFLKGLYGFIVAFLLCYLFSSILEDLEYITGMALIGELIYLIFFSHQVKKYARLMDKEETALMNAQAMGQILNK